MGIKFQRKFLRPDELLQRWQCSEADLIYEVIEGNLLPVVFVNRPEDFTDREGRQIFSTDERCYKIEPEHWLGPEYLNRGYLILKSPIRESIETCSFSFFAPYQDVMDGRICMPECMFPLDKYWKEIVFAVPHVLRFEVERTEGTELTLPMEKPLGTIERRTLLTIIAALAKEAKIDITPPGRGKAAGFIEGLTDGLGAHASKRAIEEHLKKIPDALESRTK